MSLRETLSNYWYAFQQELFPRLETDLGCLSERYEFFVTVVEFVRLGPATIHQRLAGTTAGGSCGAGARLHCQGGVRHPDNARPDQAAAG